MRILLAAMLIAPLIALPLAARAQSEQQQLVDRATLAAQDMLNNQNGKDAQGVLRRARAVMICPQVFRAGFLFGGQGGSCVLEARDGGGSWSSPAFYGLGGGSIGLQAGVEDAQVMLLIMSDRGLKAVMDSQFKLGANAAATFVDLGGGVEGATTAALRADVVGFTRARGLYAGLTLGGSLMSQKSDWNQAYYGRPVGPQQILISMEATNPAADALRAVLTRFGGNQPASGAAAAVSQSGGGPIRLAPRSEAIERQPLPPPR